MTHRAHQPGRPTGSAYDSTGEAGMQDQFDVTLEDADLLSEVELTTNLIIAASETDDRLSSGEIDAILGIAPRD